MSSTSHQRKFSHKIPENSFLASRVLHSKKFFSRFAISAIAAGILTASFEISPAFGATATVNLDAASPFAVLAGSTVTNTGSSTITGDVGLFPERPSPDSLQQLQLEPSMPRTVWQVLHKPRSLLPISMPPGDLQRHRSRLILLDRRWPPACTPRLQAWA